jgi:hypothetical protein
MECDDLLRRKGHSFPARPPVEYAAQRSRRLQTGTTTKMFSLLFQAVNPQYSGFYNERVSLSSCPLKEYISGIHSFKRWLRTTPHSG